VTPPVSKVPTGHARFATANLPLIVKPAALIRPAPPISIDAAGI
jgi:hypothetical protein